MISLLEFKQTVKKFYMEYEIYVVHVVKFFLALLCLLLINSKLGYMTSLNSLPIVLMASLLCSILPVNCTIIVSALFVTGHLYVLSKECMIISVLLFLVMYLLYYHFSPKDAVAVLLCPILFTMNIPYTIPLALGLFCTPASIMSAVFGVMITYFINYISVNATALSGVQAAGETALKLQSVLTGVFQNEGMLITMVAFSITIVFVYFIRRLSIDYSPMIAIIAGSIVNLICLIIGDIIYDTDMSVVGAIIGTFISMIIMMAVQFFRFSLDYSRTEKVQFEDDDYYYYVKAVPKYTLSTKEHKVKKINRSHEEHNK